MDGFNSVFNTSINEFYNYLKSGEKVEKLFESFYSHNGIFRFIHNCDKCPDIEAVEIAKNIDLELYEKYVKVNQSKKIIGYDSGYSSNNASYNELDSRHIMMSVILLKKLGECEIGNIVEIGGGFGNWLRLNNEVINFKKWYIVDLPHLGLLQQWYLDNHNVSREKYEIVSAFSEKEQCVIQNIDLVIGTHSLSEFSWDIFESYFNNIIVKTKYLFYCYHIYSPSESIIKRKLYLILSKFVLVDSIKSEEGVVENSFFKLIN